MVGSPVVGILALSSHLILIQTDLTDGRNKAMRRIVNLLSSFHVNY